MRRMILISVLTAAMLAGLMPSASAARGGAAAGRERGVPAGAVQLSEDVFLIGTAEDHGRTVVGLAIVHRDNPAKPDGTPGKGNNKPGGNTTSSCFAPIAKGAVWKIFTEPWMLNDAGLSAGDAASFADRVDEALGAWEAAAGNEIFGSRAAFDGTAVSLASTDDHNVVEFGDLGAGGTIAVTYTWGIWGGPPRNRVIVEWDQIYNTRYAWNFDLGVPSGSEMDASNIATHEVGHAAGLTHPDITCDQETMHRYASFGETIKRTLNDGDIAGIRELYA